MTSTRILALIAALAVSAIFAGSCGDSSAEQTTAGASEQEITTHVNVVEGELEEPVQANIEGEILGMVERGEESLVLLKVDSFKQLGRTDEAINVPSGGELLIRIRGSSPLSMGN